MSGTSLWTILGVHIGRSITYDYANRPISVTLAGQVTTFAYAGTGARQQKVVDGVTTYYAGMAEIRNFGTVKEQVIPQTHADFRIVDGVVKKLTHMDGGHVFVNQAAIAALQPAPILNREPSQ